MKIITVIGPPGSGKDTIIEALLKKFNKANANFASRSIYCSSRNKHSTDKPGINIFLISRKDFTLRKKKGLIVSTDISNGDFVGHYVSELLKNQIVFA